MKPDTNKMKTAYQLLRKGGWLAGAAFAILLLALTLTPPALASRSNQTVPIPTPTATSTPVSTSTPTNTPAPATNTPVPPATDTPVPGATSTPANTPAPGATQTPTNTAVPPTSTAVPVQNTPVPTFSMTLEMSAPAMAFPGGEVEIRFIATNPSSGVANNVRVRNRLPDTLVLIAADAEDGGASFLETEENGATVVLFAWDTLAAGQSVEATILAMVAPDASNGSIIDNLSVTYADNAASNTAGISIGLPPAILPFFD